MKLIPIVCMAISTCCNAEALKLPFYEVALVRDLSSAFENSLKINPPPIPIDLTLAKQQHEKYIDLLKTLVPEVIRLEADPNHPDCNFIEDTALIIGDTAIICRMGAKERQGEEAPVAEALDHLGMKSIYHLQTPGTMDGGDLLYTGKHLFVGLSKRTNQFAVQQLQDFFQGTVQVIGIPVLEGLHLKSLVTFFDSETLILSASPGGWAIQEAIQQSAPNDYTFVSVPDSIASNVLRIGSTLIIQEGFPGSEKILSALCEQKQVRLVKLNMSELIKADGALTCGSLLLNR